jgi:hypothetical protein
VYIILAYIILARRKHTLEQRARQLRSKVPKQESYGKRMLLMSWYVDIVGHHCHCKCTSLFLHVHITVTASAHHCHCKCTSLLLQVHITVTASAHHCHCKCTSLFLHMCISQSYFDNTPPEVKKGKMGIWVSNLCCHNATRT